MLIMPHEKERLLDKTLGLEGIPKGFKTGFGIT
jgi:hypothetical protein